MICPNCGSEMEEEGYGIWVCPECGYSEDR